LTSAIGISVGAFSPGLAQEGRPYALVAVTADRGLERHRRADDRLDGIMAVAKRRLDGPYPSTHDAPWLDRRRGRA
jgi:hypothetical protein